MAKRSSNTRHATTRPGTHEKGGGKFGFPVGSKVTITEAMYTTWDHAGERAITKNRQPDDPCLYIAGTVEGIEDQRDVHLGCGKAARLQPSSDGEFLDIPEGSSASGLGDNSNAAVFINSIHPFNKKDNPDGQAKGALAVPEELHADGVSALLVGMVFVAGAKKIERDGLEGESRPTLVADEIVKLPKAARKGKPADDDDTEEEPEEEEDEKPKRGKKSAPAAEEEEEEEEEGEEEEEEEEEEGDEDSAATKAEKYTLKALAKKGDAGIVVSKAYAEVFPFARADADKKDLMAFVKDEAWMKNKKRPWSVKGGSIFEIE